MDVGSNLGEMLLLYFLFLFSKLVFLRIMHMLRIVFFFFLSCSMLYLLGPRLCFFIVFNLDLFVNREDSLMS